MTSITLQLRAEDAEPILRKNAYEAAKFGAWCDYITRKTYRSPTSNLNEARATWQANFLAAKRIVEAFGVDYEPTSEEETIHITYPVMKNEKRTPVNIAGVRFVRCEGGETDYSKPYPTYRGEVHNQACHAAAERVVKAWRQTLAIARAA